MALFFAICDLITNCPTLCIPCVGPLITDQCPRLLLSIHPSSIRFCYFLLISLHVPFPSAVPIRGMPVDLLPHAIGLSLNFHHQMGFLLPPPLLLLLMSSMLGSVSAHTCGNNRIPYGIIATQTNSWGSFSSTGGSFVWGSSVTTPDCILSTERCSLQASKSTTMGCRRCCVPGRTVLTRCTR